MKIIETIQAAHAHVRQRQRQLESILVPTMGALHRGHLELIRLARERAGEGAEVAVSIFVNPLQFEPGSDFEKYPRPRERDEQLCRQLGVDLLFRPSVNEMYVIDKSAYVDESQLSLSLEGAARPGHFRGVCTVVTKLFHLLVPVAAIFGEKDFQQLAIIRRMVRDLNFPIEIIGAPTVRDVDGLALSSRNQYLNGEQRDEARLLFRALEAAKKLVGSGERDAEKLIASASNTIAAAKHARIDYISIVDGDTLEPVDTVEPNAVMLIAVFMGKTRLIDNIRLSGSSDGISDTKLFATTPRRERRSREGF